MFMDHVLMYCNSTENSRFLEHDDLSASQNILCILYNRDIHYPVHKIPSLVLILRRMNPIHAVFLKIYFNIILSSSSSSRWSLFSRCFDKVLLAFFSYRKYVYVFCTQPIYPFWICSP
jgi:hypothetical protein